MKLHVATAIIAVSIMLVSCTPQPRPAMSHAPANGGQEGDAIAEAVDGPSDTHGSGSMTMVWQEGEDYADSSRAGLAKTEAEGRGDAATVKLPASGGKALGGPSVEFKGSTVRYIVDVPASIKDAQIIFRHARLNWRNLQPEVPARFLITINANGESRTHEMQFGDTGGWGTKSAHYRWLALAVGDLPAGQTEVVLHSLKDDNSIVLDGFLVAPPTLRMESDEASDLVRMVISGDGYCGLVNPSTVYTELRPTISVVARSFDGRQAEVGWRAEGVAPSDDSPLCTTEACGRRLCVQQLTRSEDGPCTLIIEATRPRLKLTVPVLLAGELASALPLHVNRLKDKLAVAEGAKSGGDDGALAECVPDFRAAVDFLDSGLDKLPAARDPEMMIASLRETIDQGEETLRRLQAGQALYAGRTGPLRRGFISKATGQLVPYRIMVPESYGTQDKMPLVMVLGGSGASENIMFDHDKGLIPRMLAERGYMQITPPTYVRDRMLNVKDYMQLIELTLKEYPKLDRKSVYATGVSSGGFHSFALGVAHPDMFAGIACVSGTTRNPEAPEVARLKTVPTLIIHGGTDTVVPPSVAENTAQRLEELGAVYEMKIFPANGHDYRTLEYLPLTLQWWAAHPKASAPAP